MPRTLPFLYLLTLLIVGYTGGTVLYRLSGPGMAETVAVFADRRTGLAESGFPWRAAAAFLMFHVLALFFASHAALRHAVMFLAGIRTVYFGLASAFLISQESAMKFYALWWFPGQLLLTVLFILFCMNLAPPFMLKRHFGRDRQAAALRIAVLSLIVCAGEMGLFYFLAN
ncbi:hypothetical protein [Edaphobacillus lindanitolerans]|uniref:Stage II sporulation protein M n=1 Tax=Edaphobacillus lindanitolerans TaxID=550447 RepID=A0A1U7PHD6_9BACI|nr:hypothetical protein [Edaphobacillus lindanitolerans]SIT66826.1 hypothetical protein SAMN05428946_0132 [Edaphobacillus lindanitolerans]